MKNKYTPAEAAKFLNITLESLMSLTDARKIRFQDYHGERYYLGGELDFVKSSLYSEEGVEWLQPME